MADFFSLNPRQVVHLQADASQRKKISLSANGPVLVGDSDDVAEDSLKRRAGDDAVVDRPVWLKPEDFHGVASLIVFSEGEDDFPPIEKAEAKPAKESRKKKAA